MISLYRWQPGRKCGTWADTPDLPANCAAVPEGEIWWVDLADPTPEEEALVFQKFLPIHTLSIEDIARPRREPGSAPHLPKVEEFPDYLFVIANALAPNSQLDGKAVELDLAGAVVQLSAVMTERVLITHHYTPFAAVSVCRQYVDRHGEQAGRGPDFLFHLILDNLVDEFAPEIDRLVERLDEVEETIFDQPTQQLVLDLVRLKRRVIALRKTLILMREVLARLTRGEFDLVADREIVYYRNVFDHLVRYTELIDGAREMVSDLMQTHLAAASHRLNGIMKALAMVSTIILPMSLVASIYGMNFDAIPELKWKYGYPFALGLMFLVALGCLWFFYRKRWV
jgi:magnesium transporter